MSKLSTLSRYGLPAAVIGLAMGTFTLLHAAKPEPEREDAIPRPTTVYTSTVEATSTQLAVETQGEVRARTALDLVAQVSGRITAVSTEFTEGGRFAPGDVIIELEDDDYRLALRQAEAAVAEAELAVQQALADADVARKQLSGVRSPSDLALKKPQIAQAKARQAAAIAGLERARLDLERTRISLPFAGRVAVTEVDVGQYVNVGTRLGTAFAVDTVEVRLPFSDRQLAALGLPIGYSAENDQGRPDQGRPDQGRPDRGRPVIFSTQLAGKLHTWEGRLLRLDASIDPTTRMIYGLAEVSDPYGAGSSAAGMPLAVGLFVNASISGKALDNVLRIPANALRPGDSVYIINDRNRLEVRPVRVVHHARQNAFIDSGIRAGERVVTSALDNPIEGMSLEGQERPAVAVRGH